MMRESWGSRFGFLVATAGFSIGLGTIWRFPYLVGQNGGGAFLAVYVLIAIMIGVPLFTAEISLGRKTKLTPIAGMRKLSGGRRSGWTLFGWFGVLAAFLIMSYYQIILGWIVAYLFKTITGQFVGASRERIEAAYSGFVADAPAVLGYTALVAILHVVVVVRGVRKGVEQANKWMMPLLLALLIVLAIVAVTLPGAGEGVRWLLQPDVSKVNASVVLAALGQAFYSIGIGMASAFVYGSYLHPTDSDIPGGAALVVGALTITAVIAGLVIFPALFAFGLQPNGGPGLLFITMTNLFARAPGGPFIGGVFFFLALLAGFTSSIALVEGLAASLTDSFGINRNRAVVCTVIAIYLLSGSSKITSHFS